MVVNAKKSSREMWDNVELEAKRRMNPVEISLWVTTNFSDIQRIDSTLCSCFIVRLEGGFARVGGLLLHGS